VPPLLRGKRNSHQFIADLTAAHDAPALAQICYAVADYVEPPDITRRGPSASAQLDISRNFARRQADSGRFATIQHADLPTVAMRSPTCKVRCVHRHHCRISFVVAACARPFSTCSSHNAPSDFRGIIRSFLPGIALRSRHRRCLGDLSFWHLASAKIGGIICFSLCVCGLEGPSR
jgi:hypothetical protein